MTTTELITPPRVPGASEPPTAGELLAETAPLAGVIPGFGPPVASLAVPWLLVALPLAGPFAVLFTFVVVIVAVTLLVLLTGTILASPYLLVRHLRRRRTGHVSVRRPALRLLPAHPRRARA